MTVSDRTIIFLVTSLLAAATLGSANIIDENSVFKDKIFEFQTQQIANSIDAMVYTDEGFAEKSFKQPTYLRIEGGFDKELTVDRENLERVTVDLDSRPSNVEIEDAFVICIRKSQSPFTPEPNSVDVEEGQC